jgi:transcriptional regulator with XRE-family HTH domain
LTSVTDDLVRRGQEITRRRLRHGIRHATDLAQRTGLDRKTIARAEAGEASRETLELLEQYLDGLDAETGIDSKAATENSADLEPGVVRFTIRGPGSPWEVETEAHVENLAEVTRAVEEILRNMPRND